MDSSLNYKVISKFSFFRYNVLSKILAHFWTGCKTTRGLMGYQTKRKQYELL